MVIPAPSPPHEKVEEGNGITSAGGTSGGRAWRPGAHAAQLHAARSGHSAFVCGGGACGAGAGLRGRGLRMPEVPQLGKVPPLESQKIEKLASVKRVACFPEVLHAFFLSTVIGRFPTLCRLVF